MTEDQKIKRILGFDDAQMEQRIMEDWMRWCMNKSFSYSFQAQTRNSEVTITQRNDFDLQNLVADTALYRFWLDVYMDCLLDFIDFVEGMNPMPTPEEAVQLLNRTVVDTHRLYSKSLLSKARSKKIVLCAKQN